MTPIERRAPTRRRAVLAAIAALFLIPFVGEAQVRRGVQQRDVTPREDRTTDVRPDATDGQLLARFARRVGQALDLDGDRTRRLLEELRRSRTERGRIGARIAGVRAELGRLIRSAPADESRIGELVDELFELEVERARVGADEQRRLGEFLTPLQRARVLWLQQRLARQALQRGADGPVP